MLHKGVERLFVLWRVEKCIPAAMEYKFNRNIFGMFTIIQTGIKKKMAATFRVAA